MQDAAELDDENARDDLSDENNNDDDITAAMAKPKSVSAAAEGEMQMSVAEMQEIIERQKRQISYLTEQVRQHDEEKQNIIDSFKQSTSMLIERLKDLESQQMPQGHERPQTAIVLENIRK